MLMRGNYKFSQIWYIRFINFKPLGISDVCCTEMYILRPAIKKGKCEAV